MSKNLCLKSARALLDMTQQVLHSISSWNRIQTLQLIWRKSNEPYCFRLSETPFSAQRQSHRRSFCMENRFINIIKNLPIEAVYPTFGHDNQGKSKAVSSFNERRMNLFQVMNNVCLSKYPASNDITASDIHQLYEKTGCSDSHGAESLWQGRVLRIFRLPFTVFEYRNPCPCCRWRST